MVIAVKETFIKMSFNYINNHQSLDHYNEVKIKYGLEVMYSFITKTTAILIMSLVMKVLAENTFVLLFYGLLRTFAHGIHAKSNTNCWLSTMITYFLTGLFCKYIKLPRYVYFIISILSITIISLFAPADTKYRPIRRENKRIKLKILSITTSLILSLLLFTSFKYKNSIIASFFLCIIAINPITYKLMKMTRNNYRN